MTWIPSERRQNVTYTILPITVTLEVWHWTKTKSTRWTNCKVGKKIVTQFTYFITCTMVWYGHRKQLYIDIPKIQYKSSRKVFWSMNVDLLWHLKLTCDPPSTTHSRTHSWMELDFLPLRPLHPPLLVMTRGHPLGWRTWLVFCRCWSHRVTRSRFVDTIEYSIFDMIQESHLIVFYHQFKKSRFEVHTWNRFLKSIIDYWLHETRIDLEIV